MNPKASNTLTIPGTASAKPPACPRVAIERIKAPASDASSIRTRSPRIAPPVKGDDGSTAKTAGLYSDVAKSLAREAVRVDFPAPGAPVIPITCDLSERLCVTSATCSAAAPPLSTSVKSRPTERLSPLLAFSTSEITVESSIATGGHCLTNTFGYIFSGCART